MKKIYLEFCITILAAVSTYAQQVNLLELYSKKQIPELDRILSSQKNRINERDRKIFMSTILNAYGQAEKSNEILKTLSYNIDQADVKDTLLVIAFKTMYDNYIKLADYKNAYSIGNTLFSRYRAYYTSKEVEDEESSIEIWNILANSPRQEIERRDNSIIDLKKDMAGLLNIPVTSGDSTYNFIFDSGAGLSVITESYRQKLKMRLVSDKKVNIKSGITDTPTQASIAIAEHLTIGNMKISNAVFLVFPDNALTFANGVYKINGIIGFPIIKDFGTLKFTNQTRLFVPKDKQSGNRAPNMIIDALKPVIFLGFNGFDLPFTFDTGAQESIISDNFYMRFKSIVEKSGMEKTRSFGSANNSRLRFNGFEIPALKFTSYNQPIILKNAFVSKDPISTNGDKYYGNIGQDIIKQFNSMTISFEGSYILFE